jgi:hypothetical protein
MAGSALGLAGSAPLVAGAAPPGARRVGDLRR